MQKLFLYNTLSRKKEEFKPIKKGEIGLYTCGPTVYNYAHIGNLRSYVFADLLVRMLRYNYGNNQVKWVMNITDVDDKTIRDAKAKYPDEESMKALNKFIKEYENYFWEDIKKLNILKPDVVPHAASKKYIKKMQQLVVNIVKAGFGYEKEGSIYFNLAKYCQENKYGKLINLDMSGFKTGARVDADEYEKENIQDFVLWKGEKEGEPYWDFKLKGKSLPGRPGWHIECSAMGESELGMPFDIHTGGVDLKFPHHENEIAQSVIGYETKKTVNYWLHNEHLLVDGMKMSKRYNNFYTLRDLISKDYNPLALRFLYMQTHYGKQMNFTFASLKSAEEGLQHFINQARELGDKKGKVDNNFKNKFLKAINDDLNMSQALAVAQELLKSDLSNEDKLATVLDFDKVLGLNLEKALEYSVSPSPSPEEDKENWINELKEKFPSEIVELILKREKAREEKKYQKSDKLRDEIERMGYVVEDTDKGMRVFRK